MEIVKPELNYLVGWGGRTEYYRDDQGDGGCVGSRRGSPGRVQQHSDPGLRGQHLQHADAVERPCRQRPRAGRLQRRRLLPGRAGRGDLRNITKVLYPNDEPIPSAKQTAGWPSSTSSSPCSLQDVLHLLEDFAGLPVRQLRNASRSSSTTPTRRSRSPNSCDC